MFAWRESWKDYRIAWFKAIALIHFFTSIRRNQSSFKRVNKINVFNLIAGMPLINLILKLIIFLQFPTALESASQVCVFPYYIFWCILLFVYSIPDAVTTFGFISPILFGMSQRNVSSVKLRVIPRAAIACLFNLPLQIYCLRFMCIVYQPWSLYWLQIICVLIKPCTLHCGQLMCTIKLCILIV